MEKVLVLSAVSNVAKTQAKQLKIIMNLPVRIISDNKVMDIEPLVEVALPVITREKRLYRWYISDINTKELNFIITFFKGCELDDLVTKEQVAQIYQVSVSSVQRWTITGHLKATRITNNLTVYKRSELPTLAQVYGNSFECE